MGGPAAAGRGRSAWKRLGSACRFPASRVPFSTARRTAVYDFGGISAADGPAAGQAPRSTTKVEYPFRQAVVSFRRHSWGFDNKKWGMTMATPDVVDWDAIIRDPRFQSLHRRKTLFLWGLMAVSVVYYFLLPVGAAYYQDLFKIRVWGPINVGLVFALSEFVVAWAIAVIYSRKASRDFDKMAAEIAAEFGVKTQGAST
jgi:uncharacterized membrane protein (DUF485 family)